MKLSIVTINYNNREGLQRTIESVVNQISLDFEYIVIDGGSTDGSVDVIKQYSTKIDYWVSEPDRGIYHAMNKGIDVAKGEYCIFMNSGDLLYNEDTIKQAMPHLDGTNIIVGQLNVANKDVKKPENNITFRNLYEGSIAHQASFIQTSLLKKYHYDESLKIVSDWKFFLQTLIIDDCTYKAIDLFIATYDLNGISETNKVLYKIERSFVKKQLFSARILEDYHRFEYGKTYDEILYIAVSKSVFKRFFYTLIIGILKIGCLFKKGHWSKGIPLFLGDSVEHKKHNA